MPELDEPVVMPHMELPSAEPRDMLAPAPMSDDEAHVEAPHAAAELAGKKVLVVDDDIRNVFALTSALEAHGMRVLHAESGKEGIELLKRTSGIEVVLMDVMMPGLDGLDTMRIIRQLDGYRSLPIIAVTAKAMMGDRDKCIEAGERLDQRRQRLIHAALPAATCARASRAGHRY